MADLFEDVKERQDLTDVMTNALKLLTVAHTGGKDLSTVKPALTAVLAELEQALSAAGISPVEPDGTATVKDAASVPVQDGAGHKVTGLASVTGNTLNSVTLPTTSAIATDADAISIQDRNGNTLKGDAVRARVVNGELVSAYFTSLTDSLVGDGKPVDVTIERNGSTVAGRIRMYVSSNVVKNAYLDGAAMLQNGAAVRVQNASALGVDDNCTAILNGNTLTAVQLPAAVSAIRDGKVKVITDAAGKTANATPVVTAGNLTSQTLEGTAALTKNGSAVTLDGKTYTFTVAAGAITAVAVTDAPAA